MAHRTTLILDEVTRVAAQRLARHQGCTVSEAIRRSVLAQRDRVLGVPPAAQRERRAALSRLFELFRGNDPNGEIRKLKADDAGF